MKFNAWVCIKKMQIISTHIRYKWMFHLLILFQLKVKIGSDQFLVVTKTMFLQMKKRRIWICLHRYINSWKNNWKTSRKISIQTSPIITCPQGSVKNPSQLEIFTWKDSDTGTNQSVTCMCFFIKFNFVAKIDFFGLFVIIKPTAYSFVILHQILQTPMHLIFTNDDVFLVWKLINHVMSGAISSTAKKCLLYMYSISQ